MTSTSTTIDAPVEQLRELPTVDLAELARKGVQMPELVCDRLLYRGCLHSLAGPPEAGKSTLAYWWALGKVDQDQAVVVVDVEAGPEQVTEKLLALGAKPDGLERLTYVHYPEARWDAADLTGLRKLVERTHAALVLFDSIGVALAQAGKDENHVSEVQPLYSALLALARDKQAAVVLLDHVTKDAKGGRYARGSGAKLQLVDVALMVDVVRPFDRQHSGQLRLAVSKDRRGYLGRHHDVKVEVDQGRMTLTVMAVDPAAPDADAGRLPPAAVKLLATLRGREEPQTVKELGDRIKRETGQALTWPTMRKQLNLLAELGFADGEGDPGKAKKWWALRSEEGGVPDGPTL
jgi:AAA domain